MPCCSPECTSCLSEEWRPSEPRPDEETQQLVCDLEEEQGKSKYRNTSAVSHSEAGMKPVGGAVLALYPLTQAGSRGADVLVRTLTGEDPLIQTAGGQNVFLIHSTEGQTVGIADQRTQRKTRKVE